MEKIFTAPNRYIQGYDIMRQFGKYVSYLGSKAFILGGTRALASVGESISQSVDEDGITCDLASFRGKCTRKEASRLAQKAEDFGAQIIVGAGGGAALDTAKAVSFEMDLPLVMVPTIASTDAACSASAVQHTEDDQFDRVISLKKNPDLIIADSRIIAEAPTRFFVAGMGDALSTWFEAQTCSKSGATNSSGGVATATGMAVARLAYDMLLEHGLAARLAVEQNAVTPAVDTIIEANILLSSVGFENCGLAAAHSIAAGIGALRGAEDRLHGELVAFSTIADLVLENYPREAIQEVIGFCHDVGLPITMKQLGVMDLSPANLMKATEVAFVEGYFMRNLYFEATPELVVDSIIGADALGLYYRSGR